MATNSCIAYFSFFLKLASVASLLTSRHALLHCAAHLGHHRCRRSSHLIQDKISPAGGLESFNVLFLGCDLSMVRVIIFFLGVPFGFPPFVCCRSNKFDKCCRSNKFYKLYGGKKYEALRSEVFCDEEINRGPCVSYHTRSRRRREDKGKSMLVLHMEKRQTNLISPYLDLYAMHKRFVVTDSKAK